MSARGAAALALALALCGGARAEEPEEAKAAPRRKVALDPLRVNGVAPALAQAVEDRVCALIGDLADADVVCPSDVAAAATLARTAVVLGECQSDECLRRVDAVKRADRRVTGALERGEPGSLVLSLQVTSEAGPGPRLVEKLPEDLDALVARLPALVKKLFP